MAAEVFVMTEIEVIRIAGEVAGIVSAVTAAA